MTKSQKNASIAAAMESVDLSEAISSVSLSEQNNLGGETGASTTEQVNDYFTKDGATQVDQSSRATAEQTFDPTAKNDVNGEAENKTQFEQTNEGTQTGDYTRGGQGTGNTGFLNGYDFGGGSNKNRPPGTATSKDPNYIPPSNYRPPEISAAPPGAARREAPEINPMSDAEYLQAVNLTVGASNVDPMMAQMNSTFITAGLLGSAAPAIATAAKVAAAPAMTFYLQNAPQINQVGETVIRDLFDASGPSFYTGLKENLPGGSKPGIWNQ